MWHVIPRDYLFIRGKTIRFAGRISVLEVEMVGILEDLLWLHDIPAQVITIESDSLMSVNAVNNGDHNVS